MKTFNKPLGSMEIINKSSYHAANLYKKHFGLRASWDGRVQSTHPITNLSLMTLLRTSYTVKKKIIVVRMARVWTLAEVARRTRIPISCICRWRSSLEYLIGLPPTFANHRKVGCGRKPALSTDQEARVKAEVEARRLRLEHVSMQDICTIAQTLYSAHSEYSTGWLAGFCARVGLSWRRITGYTTKPSVLVNHKAVEAFRQAFVERTRAVMLGGGVELINMDETAVYLDMPYKYSVSQKGAKHVKIQTYGRERKGVTVVLACSSTGDKLPPMVLTDRKTLRSITVPVGLIVECGVKSAFMNQGVMVKWLRLHSARLQGTGRMLLLDSFSGHKTQSVREQARECDISIDYIPPGTTSSLQPLDVGIMKPFKDGIRARWKCYMVTNQQKPGFQQLLDWVASSWNAVGADVVKTSFRKAFLSFHPTVV